MRETRGEQETTTKFSQLLIQPSVASQQENSQEPSSLFFILFHKIIRITPRSELSSLLLLLLIRRSILLQFFYGYLFSLSFSNPIRTAGRSDFGYFVCVIVSTRTGDIGERGRNGSGEFPFEGGTACWERRELRVGIGLAVAVIVG